jgi:hypothetical protein
MNISESGLEYASVTKQSNHKPAVLLPQFKNTRYLQPWIWETHKRNVVRSNISSEAHEQEGITASVSIKKHWVLNTDTI